LRSEGREVCLLPQHGIRHYHGETIAGSCRLAAVQPQQDPVYVIAQVQKEDV
jgi:hypothetical protein